MVPHRFPFRLVESGRRGAAREGGVRVVATANAARARGGPYPRALAIEVMAQAAYSALVDDLYGSGRHDGSLASGDVAGTDLFVASVENVELAADLVPGDVLVASARLVGGYGDLYKIASLLRRADEVVASADLLVGLRRG